MQVKIDIRLAVAVCSLLLGLLMTGCGGESEPVERTDQVLEQVRQEDAEIEEGESGL